jgi:hypothetical protein
MPNIDTSIDVPLREISGKTVVYRNATSQDKGFGAWSGRCPAPFPNAGLDRRLGKLRPTFSGSAHQAEGGSYEMAYWQGHGYKDRGT